MALAGGIFLLIVAVVYGLALGVRLLFGIERDDIRPALLVLSGVVELALVALAWRFGPGRHGGGWRALGFRGFAPRAGLTSALGTVVAGFSVVILYGLLIRALQQEQFAPEGVRELIGNEGTTVLLAGFLAAVVAPLAEETFFRGFLLSGLKTRLGTVRALLISSGAFALFHGDPRVFIPTFCLGLFLGSVFLSTGSVIPSMLAHGLYNGTVVVIAYLVQRVTT
jgi:membrane protease YdiL (CAAX protease family)